MKNWQRPFAQSHARRAVIVCLIACSACQWHSDPVVEEPTSRGLLYDVEIVGNRSFNSYINWAAELLEQKAPGDLRFFLGQGIARIEQVQANSGIYYGASPAIRLTDTTTFYSLTWLAGVLVHEACHLAQYRQVEADRGNPFSRKVRDFNSAITELACIQHQLAVARAIGAPQKEIRQLLSADGSHAYTTPSAQDW
jgi:hypothetical protein|tara:strand:+ start:578 stop:1165 length:588 start_codon:yes stop_codon:yes gene_type:complete